MADENTTEKEVHAQVRANMSITSLGKGDEAASSRPALTRFSLVLDRDSDVPTPQEIAASEPFKTRDEMRQALKDPRYAKSASYRSAYAAKLAATDQSTLS